MSLDYWQIHLRPNPARLPPPGRQHGGALVRLVKLHFWRHHRILYHCKRDSRIQRPGVPGGGLARNAHVLPSHGWYVAVR